VKLWGPGLIVTLALAVGCGGGGSSQSGGCCTVPGISVQVVSPVGPAAVDGNQTLDIKVTVTNDSSNAGVTWSVAPAVKGGPTGTLPVQQPLEATYAPPNPVTSPLQVTVTATSVADSTRSVAIPISIYLPLSVATQSSDLAVAFPKTDYTCILQPITNGVTQIPCQLNAAGGLAPYTWSVTSGSLPFGLSLQPGPQNSTVIIGQPTIPGIYPFTASVTDATGNTASGPLNVNVAPSRLKVVTPTLLSTFLNQPYVPVALQASGGVPPYTWSLFLGSNPLPPGITLSSNGVISGTPTDVSVALFALLVEDSQSPVPAQAVFPTPLLNNAQIIHLGPSNNNPACMATGNNVVAGSPYAFVLSGFDADGPVTLSGSFTADTHGNLTSGVEDIIRQSGTLLAQPLVAGGSIGFDNVGRGCLTLTTATISADFRLSTTTTDPNTNLVLDASVIAWGDSNGAGTRGAGSIRKQDSTAFAASPTGTYAFRLSGWDVSSGHFALAGVATAGTGLFTNVTADVNDSGTFAGPLSGGSGSFSSADTNG